MRISAIEYQLASRLETMAELARINPEWNAERLVAKTGIAQHYVAAEGETALSLAEQACKALLAGTDRATVDGMVYVTQSPESGIPTTACLLHARLGLPEKALAFDLNQGCSGFVYGLSVACAMLGAGMVGRCLVVCAETYNRYISRHDRTCRPIFSDGASAVLVERDGTGQIGPFVFATDGTGAPNLTLKANDGVEDVAGPVLYMHGPNVLRYSVDAVPRAIDDLLARAGLTLDQIDLFMLHQASKVVLDRIELAMGLDPARVFRNYDTVGNTVSATIPIALKQATRAGRFGPGMTVLLMGFGVGYSLAGCILRT